MADTNESALPPEPRASKVTDDLVRAFQDALNAHAPPRAHVSLSEFVRGRPELADASADQLLELIDMGVNAKAMRVEISPTPGSAARYLHLGDGYGYVVGFDFDVS